MEKEKSHYRLPSLLIKISEAKNWDDAKKEWEIDYSDNSKDFLSCLCSHPIKEIIHIQNKKNKKRVMIGNCCEKVLFGINTQSKIFQAIRKKRINAELIDMGLKKKVINQMERDFAINVWRCRRLTAKQQAWFDSIKNKLLQSYKNI